MMVCCYSRWVRACILPGTLRSEIPLVEWHYYGTLQLTWYVSCSPHCLQHFHSTGNQSLNPHHSSATLTYTCHLLLTLTVSLLHPSNFWFIHLVPVHQARHHIFCNSTVHIQYTFKVSSSIPASFLPFAVVDLSNPVWHLLV